MRRVIPLVASLTLLLTSATATAVPIGTADFSGSETVIDFDSIAVLTLVTDLGSGVSVNESLVIPLIDSSIDQSLITPPNGLINRDSLGGTTGGFEFVFTDSINRVGAYTAAGFGQDVSIQIFDADGALIETIFGRADGVLPVGSGGGVQGFLGVESQTDIARAVFTLSAPGALFPLDTLRFEAVDFGGGVIPEPNTALLALVSLVMVRMGVRARLA
jgi:hypothetical protein